jgi:hypothetical protein
MPVHNYMLEDLLGTLRAIAIFPVFLLFPGYVIAWLLDLLDFRRRTLAFRVTFAVPLSIALCPILTFLLARYASFAAVWVFYSITALVFCLSFALDLGAHNLPRPFWPAGSRTFAFVLGIWLVICLGSLIDLQIGDRLYYPVSAIDYSIRTGFLHSISTTGVPPQNPFFHPGHSVALRYHYFWLMMCSLANQVGGSSVTGRIASIGGTFWAGAGLIGLVLVYLRILYPKPDFFRKRAIAGVLLLGVTGLDILPSLFFLFLYARGALGFALPSVEWWNEHVDWFLYSTIWAPHAIASMIASFVAFLLIWRATSESHTTGLLRYVIPAGIALASSVGCSIYVTFVFAIFLALWTVVTVWKKWFRETAALLATGLVMVALTAPYLRDLMNVPAGTGGPSEPLFQLTVRTFSFAALVQTHGLSQTARLLLVNLPLLPLNYLLEFGFFFLIALYNWRRHRTTGEPLTRIDLAFTLMLAVSVLACTFLRSSIGCNDLGWRGLLIAEFVLLLWAADLFPDRDRVPFLNFRQRELLIVFVALGVAGSVYDLAIVRLFPVLADRGVVPPLDWMSPDRDMGHRTYAARTAYEWLRGVTPPTATVQSNPNVVFQDTLGMIYSDRPTVAADTYCLAGFGGNIRECQPLMNRLLEIFPAKGHSTTAGLRDVCGTIAADMLIAKDTDAAWEDRGSWIWRENPVYANSYVRVFSCPVRTAAR